MERRVIAGLAGIPGPASIGRLNLAKPSDPRMPMVAVPADIFMLLRLVDPMRPVTKRIAPEISVSAEFPALGLFALKEY
jgi:hypothetical protein